MELSIAICDDEKVEIDYLTGLVSKWANAQNISVHLEKFYSAENFLFAYKEEVSVDILLLDIEMKELNGVELARKIRCDNETIQIVFITGYPDYVAEGYDVSALHYLVKPVSGGKLFEVLDRAVKRLSKKEASLLIDTSKGMVLLELSDIVYIEAFDHTLEVYTKNDGCTVKMPLKKFEEKLTGNFIHCHRSYIVNLAYIKKITRINVVTDAGKALPLSRRLYAEVNRAMMEYLTRGKW